jgi:hypothetical protein
MSAALREKANSFDRILRQKTASYLKDSEKHTLRLMELSYDKGTGLLQKRIDRLRSGISQIRNDIEYGSFVALPAMRSGRQLHTETPNDLEEEISQLLFVDELVLLESSDFFAKLQNSESIFYDSSEELVIQYFGKAEESLRRIENLQRLRSSAEKIALETMLSNYTENVDEITKVAEKEHLIALENSQLAGVFAMDQGTPFERFISKLGGKPVFEEEIGNSILNLASRLKLTSGGLVRLPALFSMVRADNPTIRISIEDVEKVVRKYEKKGLIAGLRNFAGMKIVELVPMTATPDQNIVLDLASETGRLQIEYVLTKTKWTYERANRALRQMEEFGMAKYEVTNHEWVFPVFLGENKPEGAT